MLALDHDKRIQLIRKYRYTTDTYSLEVPAGGIDLGEDPLVAAKRELREELGVEAGQWRQLGKFQAENGYMNNFGIVFVATGLSDVGQDDRLAEGINKTEQKTIEEALHLVKASKITDSQSISALTLLALDLSILK